MFQWGLEKKTTWIYGLVLDIYVLLALDHGTVFAFGCCSPKLSVSQSLIIEAKKTCRIDKPSCEGYPTVIVPANHPFIGLIFRSQTIQLLGYLHDYETSHMSINHWKSNPFGAKKVTSLKGEVLIPPVIMLPFMEVHFEPFVPTDTSPLRFLWVQTMPFSKRCFLAWADAESFIGEFAGVGHNLGSKMWIVPYSWPFCWMK